MLISNIFFISSFALLQAWTGAGLIVISFIVSICGNLPYFSKTATFQRRQLVTMLILDAASIAIFIFTYAGFISFLPLIAIFCQVYSMLQKNHLTFKYLQIPQSILYFTYNWLIGSPLGVAEEIVLFTICLCGIFLDLKHLKHLKNTQN
jgi:hypothetical protein